MQSKEIEHVTSLENCHVIMLLPLIWAASSKLLLEECMMAKYRSTHTPDIANKMLLTPSSCPNPDWWIAEGALKCEAEDDGCGDGELWEVYFPCVIPESMVFETQISSCSSLDESRCRTAYQHWVESTCRLLIDRIGPGVEIVHIYCMRGTKLGYLNLIGK